MGNVRSTLRIGGAKVCKAKLLLIVFFNTSSNLTWGFESFCFSQISISFTLWSKKITTTTFFYVANDYKSRRTVVGSDDFFVFKIQKDHINVPQSRLKHGKIYQTHARYQHQKDNANPCGQPYLNHHKRYIYLSHVRHFVHLYHHNVHKYV